MKRMNSPSFVYTRSTTASRRDERLSAPVRGHLSVAYTVNPLWTPGNGLRMFNYDHARSHGTYRKH